MKLHTVIVSFNRPQLLRRTLESYLDTVTLPYTLLIVDNGSDADTLRYLRSLSVRVIELGTNLYPGPACNIGFLDADAASASHLHRSDNDMEYLPGWCDEVQARFASNLLLGQLGLRTDAEELGCSSNVGGTSVFKRELWDGGLRYRNNPWQELGAHTEDYWISLAVVDMGWQWGRVQRPCVVHIASGDLDDPYYQHSYGVRGII